MRPKRADDSVFVELRISLVNVEQGCNRLNDHFAICCTVKFKKIWKISFYQGRIAFDVNEHFEFQLKTQLNGFLQGWNLALRKLAPVIQKVSCTEVPPSDMKDVHIK